MSDPILTVSVSIRHTVFAKYSCCLYINGLSFIIMSNFSVKVSCFVSLTPLIKSIIVGNISSLCSLGCQRNGCLRIDVTSILILVQFLYTSLNGSIRNWIFTAHSKYVFCNGPIRSWIITTLFVTTLIITIKIIKTVILDVSLNCCNRNSVINILVIVKNESGVELVVICVIHMISKFQIIIC